MGFDRYDMQLWLANPLNLPSAYGLHAQAHSACVPAPSRFPALPCVSAPSQQGSSNAELRFLLSLFQVVLEQLTVVKQATSKGRKLHTAATPPTSKGLSMADLLLPAELRLSGVDGTVVFEHHPMEVMLVPLQGPCCKPAQASTM